MTLDDVKTLLRNKLAALARQRDYAFAIGDLDRVVALDAERDETQTTIDQLEAI
jgi:hypothetical protein